MQRSNWYGLMELNEFQMSEIHDGCVLREIDFDRFNISIIRIELKHAGTFCPVIDEYHISHILSVDHGRNSIRWSLPEQDIAFPSGRVGLIDPDTQICIQHGAGVAHFLLCKIDPAYFLEIVRESSWQSEWTIKVLSADSPLMRAIMDRLAGELLNPSPSTRIFVDSLLTSLVLEIQRLVSHSDDGREPLDRKLETALNLLDATCPGPTSIKQLARQVGMSAGQMRRSFRKRRGLSLHSHIADMRMEKAKGLLLDGSKPIKAVAAEAGFGSPSYFTACFRGAMGCTPSEYREKLCSAVTVQD